VGHVEAGLRSHDILSPFPEELNRRVATIVTRWHFAPTELSKKNLLAEGVPSESIYVTGNTVIDALLFTAKKNLSSPPAMDNELVRLIEGDKKIVLITAHRRENFGEPFDHICAAITEMASLHTDVEFIYPVHPNPNVRKKAYAALASLRNIHLIEPLTYKPFVKLLERSYLVLSDSGGLQEEAPALGKPILVMREATERPEGVEAGVNILVGTNKDLIVAKAHELLNNNLAYNAIAQKKNPYGDGHSSALIATQLQHSL
jgi:UDP-N-acetylglucosamine 2-epimerase